ncbi:hypothetical protein NEMBOFW57_004609 [Staphylotrichum longicolle]|uniref:Uncharacterized protein n=1 Tax=Staphylotrichum longicolle TaxID=669026 RepID=A0AAD4F8A0_9PEZI|nr:hypothetical protein NEMBOFW57_004609 [Staphylotrichum longicolle]
MTLTDEELDRDWKPSGRRPQSTIAQMFSQELMDIFRIDNSVADLDEQVDKRKQQINSQTSELEALEARIREMEMRLKGNRPNTPGGAQNAPARGQPSNTSAPPPPPEKDYPADQARTRDQQQHKYGSRPGTARQGQPAVPGALPPTPAGSEAQSHWSPSKPNTSMPSNPSFATRTKEMGLSGDDSDSITSMSESASFADYVIVPEPDGDRERDV